MTQFYSVEGNDPFILCISPSGEYFVNSHYYYNREGHRRFAYTSIEYDDGIYKSEDGTLCVRGTL